MGIESWVLNYGNSFLIYFQHVQCASAVLTVQAIITKLNAPLLCDCKLSLQIPRKWRLGNIKPIKIHHAGHLPQLRLSCPWPNSNHCSTESRNKHYVHTSTVTSNTWTNMLHTKIIMIIFVLMTFLWLR